MTHEGTLLLASDQPPPLLRHFACVNAKLCDITDLLYIRYSTVGQRCYMMRAT